MRIIVFKWDNKNKINGNEVYINKVKARRWAAVYVCICICIYLAEES